MRPLLLLPASLLLLACATSAQELPYPRTAVDPLSTVQVTAPIRTLWIRQDQALALSGYYEMSNGWQMKVRPAARHIDATIDSQKPIRLYQVAPDRFASSDGNVRMRFNQGEDGDRMTMSYVPDPRLAQVVVLTSRLARR